MNKRKNIIEPIPEASLNRYIIPTINESGLNILSSNAVMELKVKQPNDWENILSDRLFLLIKSLWEGSGWMDFDKTKQIQEIKRFWIDTKEIMIGGGVLSGDNGRRVFEQTKTLLDNLPLTGKILSLAPTAQNMAIDGILTNAKPNTLAIDFGHTFIKSSFIEKAGNKIDIKPIKVSLDGQNLRSDPEYIAELLSTIKNSMGNILKELKGEKILQLNISIAAYMEGDYFTYNFRGGYCQLRNYEPNAVNLFSKLWVDIYGEKIPIKVYHDGNAAAGVIKTKPGAIIILGTSIGYGFQQ